MSARKLAIVEWLDSNGTFGWGPEPDSLPSVCHNVGFVLSDTDEYIRLAFGMSDTDNVFCTIAIPKAAVTNITVLVAEESQ